ncbi:MAG: class E sortase [Nitriliruptor sp.]
MGSDHDLARRPASASDADRNAASPTPFVYLPEVGDGRSTPSGFVLDALRHRRLGRLLVSGLTVVLFLAGAGMFTYPFFTDLYTDRVIQERLDDEFAQLEAGSVQEWTSASRAAGSPLTRIVIPAIDVSTLVVEGTSPAALRAGAGHYPDTPLPGEVGNVGIAGHRTTYGRPFNRVDELEPGDEIWLLTPVGDHRYVVSEPDPDIGDNPWITTPDDWGVVAESDDAVLTLTSCHPKGSAQQRIIVRAELAATSPPGTYEVPDAQGETAA